jgi:hypothetical protein
MAGIFSAMIENLVRMEFFQLMFPFLLTLALMYGVLTWALKEQLPKSARGIIAIIFGFFAMLYSSMNPALYLFLTGLTGPWLMIASALLFIVILLGLVGLDLKTIGKGEKEGGWNWKMGLLALIIVFVFLAFFAGYSNIYLPFGIDLMGSDLWSIIFFVIILAVVMHFLTKEKEEKKG